MRKLNIYHRKDNRWEGRIPRGKLENGKRKFQYILGRTKEAVEQEMTRIYEEEHQKSHCIRKAIAPELSPNYFRNGTAIFFIV